uniref:Choline transporter-like protein n=1 Tax=Percolomonas cosmopolitus TaxID=63605 RepID=A0A7S1PH24_9EUKA|mmetsp:Transcript_4652/g.17518  ORF Transcript_4652/g.17518 Transcript_4652/m.17518 type:complete len:790 (+) Transcript_4652:300-2669(+)|eukprot:CAMPEP_0117443086 /NCGR_PEP_ID=MMETSP0759-20121206/4505_1 /TAXON_ID=63605 /ORGANISM="Percolomonas cosmopolitus, Strain WS" /LENGTH=789 /DNA_ID=CAMNT_0005235033 /DNA_START=721 /DNA_END=3090 /DNA_ORIENTATION=+
MGKKSKKQAAKDNKTSPVDGGESEPIGRRTRIKRSILGCPGFERCHPLAWVPCSSYARRLQKKQVKIKSGYKPDRWPTDFLCLFLFTMFWVGLVIIACFAVWSGNPYTLILPTDYQDNICGYEKGEGNFNLYDLSTKPVLWFPFSFDIEDIDSSQFIDALYMGICVESCPKEYLGYNLSSILSDFSVHRSEITEGMVICSYDKANYTFEQKLDAVENGTGCFVNNFPTQTFQKRCIPFFTGANLNFTVSSKVQTYIDTFMKVGNTLKAGFMEVRIAWFPLVLNGIIVLGLCFVMAFFINSGILKIFALVVILGVWFVMVGFTGFVGWAAANRWLNATNDDGIVDTSTRVISIVLMVIAGICFLIDLLYVCVMVFLIRRIKKAADIIQLASKPIFRVPSLMVIPPITFLCLVAITAYWLVIAGYIQSATLPVTLSTSALENLPVSNLPVNVSQSYTIRKGDATIQGMQWYHLFGFLWSSAFLSAIGYTTTAGVISQWYFSAKGNPEANYANKGKGYQKKAELLSVTRSFLRCIIFHSGSLLFGSMLVAIVQIFRVVYRKLENLVSKMFAIAACGNPAVIALCLCFKCCIRIWMFSFEMLVKFFNKNAYIMMMIHGGSFLNSGARAFGLIKDNILIVGTTNFLGHALLFLGQVIITIWGGFQTYLMIFLFNRYNARLVMGEVTYYIVPVIAGFVLSFIISGMFVNMYTTAIDTVMLCYLEDRKVRKNYPYSPPPLREDSFFQMFVPPCVNHARYLVKKLNKAAQKENEETKKADKADRKKARRSKKKKSKK